MKKLKETKKKLKVKTEETPAVSVCPNCNGTGRHLPEQTCPVCNGTGKK